MSYDMLLCLRSTSGFYNSLSNPFTHRFPQRFYDRRDYFSAMYPVVNLEYQSDYESRKTSEAAIKIIQKHGLTGIPAIAQAQYARRFDLPNETKLSRYLCVSDGDGLERIHSGRALYEYACGDVDTLKLDQRQISILESLETESAQPPLLLTIEPLWIIAFPSQSKLLERRYTAFFDKFLLIADIFIDTLCAFYDDGRDPKPGDLHTRILNRCKNDKSRDWARTLVHLVEATDRRIGNYEPIYRAWLSRLVRPTW